MTGHHTTSGSPFTPHSPEETEAMLESIGADDVEDLFDVPETVRYDGELGIEARDEPTIKQEIASILDRNEEMVELLGRGNYDHYVPSVVDQLSGRSEFLTSYTQYQAEVTQGFLQALFEFQSMLRELTGLDVVNCSMYDAASAIGEAATLASRIRETSGDRVLLPDIIQDNRRDVIENYVAGPEMPVDTYPTDDGNVDVDGLRSKMDEDVVMVYVESPTARGTIEEGLDEVGALTDEFDAMFTLGSDPVALAMLEEPTAAGVDTVVGEAGVLGLPTSFGMGTGLFATKKDYVRQVPGRLVGVSEDSNDKRSFTLTLQTREQHIRRERATSNICTNQAWVALRIAMHMALVGPSGLLDLATESVKRATDLAERVDDIDGIEAPIHDRHHFREFVARTEAPAGRIAEELADDGFAVHVLGEDELQFCVTGVSDEELDEFVSTLTEVSA
ncbi:MAG: glycine dehydrogenase subunit 1 [Halobacteriales archaeon]|jgi:glycine dehydrogenase subunit 1